MKMMQRAFSRACSLAFSLALALAPAGAQQFTPQSIAPDAQLIYRDYNSNGVPASGPYNPRKSDMRLWGAAIGNAIAQVLGVASVGAVGFEQQSGLYADLNYAQGTIGEVLLDTGSKNGTYLKIGNSGTGSWSQVSTSLFGLTPTWTIGSVTELTPGSTPTAAVGGTAAAPTLLLGIPTSPASFTLGSFSVLPPNEVPTFSIGGTSSNPTIIAAMPASTTFLLGSVTPVSPGINPSVSLSGTLANQILNFQLPTAAVPTIGTVTTASSGTPASVTITGSPYAPQMNFILPRGVTGATFAWTGGWSSSTAYNINDMVYYNGTAYIAVATNTNVTPTAGATWNILVSGGPSLGAGVQTALGVTLSGGGGLAGNLATQTITVCPSACGFTTIQAALNSLQGYRIPYPNVVTISVTNSAPALSMGTATILVQHPDAQQIHIVTGGSATTATVVSSTVSGSQGAWVINYTLSTTPPFSIGDWVNAEGSQAGQSGLRQITGISGNVVTVASAAPTATFQSGSFTGTLTRAAMTLEYAGADGIRVIGSPGGLGLLDGFAMIGDQGTPSTALVNGTSYVIQKVGTTNWIALGAASNTVGVSFVASGSGSGTGTAYTDTWGLLCGRGFTSPPLGEFGGGVNVRFGANMSFANWGHTGVEASRGCTVYGYQTVMTGNIYYGGGGFYGGDLELDAPVANDNQQQAILLKYGGSGYIPGGVAYNNGVAGFDAEQGGSANFVGSDAGYNNGPGFRCIFAAECVIQGAAGTTNLNGVDFDYDVASHVESDAYTTGFYQQRVRTISPFTGSDSTEAVLTSNVLAVTGSVMWYNPSPGATINSFTLSNNDYLWSEFNLVNKSSTNAITLTAGSAIQTPGAVNYILEPLASVDIEFDGGVAWVVGAPSGNLPGPTTLSGQLTSTFGEPYIGSSSCGSGTNNGTISGTNQSGTITISTGTTTTCQVNFSLNGSTPLTLPVAPQQCSVTPANTAAAASGYYMYSWSTGGFNIHGTALASSTFNYMCL